MNTRKLAVFDIDGVLYDGHSIFDIIKLQEEEKFIKSGTWGKIEKALYEYKSGRINYEDSANTMLKVYVSALKNMKYSEVKEYIKSYIKKNEDHFYEYVKKLMPKLHETHDIYLLTTNLSVTAETVMEELLLDGFLATEVEVKNGKFTGVIIKSLAGNKHRVIELLKKYPFEGSIAVGDSVNDIPMLEKVMFPFAMNPDQKLTEVAKNNGWEVVTEDLIQRKIIEVAA